MSEDIFSEEDKKKEDEYLDKGYQAFNKKDYKTALEYLNKAIKINRYSPASWHNKGLV